MWHTSLKHFAHESPPLHHTSFSHLPPALLTAGCDFVEVILSWQTCWCCPVSFTAHVVSHQQLHIPPLQLSLAPFLSPHATVRQRTNTLVFLIKHGVLQGEKAVMDDGRKTRRKNGLPFLCGCKSSCIALITTKVFKEHSLFKRTCRSNKVRREFNLSSLQVGFSSFLTTWSRLGEHFTGYSQILIYNFGFLISQFL